MIELEKKTKLNAYIDTIEGLTGLYVLKVASINPLSTEEILDKVFSHIFEEVLYRYNNQPTSSKVEIYRKDLNLLKSLPVIYSKQDTFVGDYGRVFYYQLVLNLDKELHANELKNTYLGSIVYHCLNDLYRAYEGNWINPNVALADFTYIFSDVRADKPGCTLMMASANPNLQTFIAKEYAAKNHIACSFETDTSKYYTRGSIIKIKCKIWDNLDEAIEHRTNNTIAIEQYDTILGRLAFVGFREDYQRRTKFVLMYNNKIKLQWHNKMAIFYDGDKSLTEVKPYLAEWEQRGIGQLDILQFSTNKDFFYQENIAYTNGGKKLILVFVAKDKIFLSRCDMRPRAQRGFYGKIVYAPKKNAKKISIDSGLEGRTSTKYIGSAVIPVDGTLVQQDALKAFHKLLKLNLPLGTDELISYEDAYNEYRRTIFGTQSLDPDTLSEWFDYCTNLSKKNNNNIVKAYEKMKKSLENEYKELNAYLHYYDFSKCAPIPRIVCDNKIKENYYKSLHIEPKNIIIKSINNKSINSIQELQPTLTFMYVNGVGKIFKNDFAIYDFYNNKTNEIELIYGNIKGEVIHDKA